MGGMRTNAARLTGRPSLRHRSDRALRDALALDPRQPCAAAARAAVEKTMHEQRKEKP